jgi:hypothetical protein
MRILVAVIAVAAFTVAAAAQSTTPMQPTTKPVDCRAEAKTKGLSGQAAKDSVALCREELRTACLKEAIDKKIVGKDRRVFVKSCSARPKGKDRV